MVEFKVDSEVKNEYLDTLPSRTAYSNSFVLKSVDEFEFIKGKQVYNFSIPEIKEMFMTQFKNSSIGSLTKNKSIVKEYVDFCISKGLVPHMENRLTILTKQNLKELVNKAIVKYRYHTKEDLQQYLDMLHNPQDRAFLLCPYIGIKGRPGKGVEEIINLQIDETSKEFYNNMLKLERGNGSFRYITVADWEMDILLEAKHSRIYESNNGVPNPNQPGGTRKIIINPIGNYVFRVPHKIKTELFTPSLLNSRMSKIKKFIGNPFITIHSLYMSGMISMAKDIYAKKGILTTDDYQDICERFGYSQQYIWTLKETVEQYL